MNNKKIIFYIIIMAVFFLPVSIYATNTTKTIEINSVEKLAETIRDQKEGETWILKEGTYNLEEKHLEYYKDWINPGTSQQSNWYFPIHENNITIKGEGNVLITTNVEKNNGAWATQDFVSIR